MDAREEFGTCPVCQQLVPVAAATCPHCQSAITPRPERAIDDLTGARSLRLGWLLITYLLSTVIATALKLVVIRTFGYGVIVIGPIYLAVFGIAFLAAAARVRPVPRNLGWRVLFVVLLGAAVFALSMISGWELGDVVNHRYFHMPIADRHDLHRLPHNERA